MEGARYPALSRRNVFSHHCFERWLDMFSDFGHFPSVGGEVRATNFVLSVEHLGGGGSQWCNRLPRRKGGSVCEAHHFSSCGSHCISITVWYSSGTEQHCSAGRPTSRGCSAAPEQYEGLTPEQVKAAGYEQMHECVPNPEGAGAMGTHFINHEYLEAQFPKGEMDPTTPP